MGTWSQLRKGTRARRRVQLPIGTGPLRLEKQGEEIRVQASGEDVVQIDLRPLTSGEQRDILVRARADAKAGGVDDPRPGIPLYDLAEMEHTLLLCCVDPDSPEEAPRPLFSSIEEIRTDTLLGSDRVLYLYELFLLWQDQCSPQRRNLSLEETLAAMALIGGKEEEEARRFFESLGPGLRWIFMRSLALLQPTSPTDKSPSGSDSTPRPSDSPPSPSKKATAIPPAQEQKKASDQGPR